MLLVATCFIIWKFIATEGVENARSVHVALETALTFNKKDSSANIQFIDDFQDFLSKVRNTVNDINEVSPSRRNYREYNPKQRDEKLSKNGYVTNQKFTKFIKEFIKVLRNYNDDDLEDVIAVVDKEIRKYHYKGCKFYELLSDNLRLMIANKLGLVKDTPVEEIRDNLDETLRMIEDAKFDPKMSELLDYIDSLYTRNDVRKFQKALGHFNVYQNKYKRSNMDLTSLVRDSIRSVIFDHYSNLNANTRRDFKARLETFFWKYVNDKDNVQHLEWTINYNDATTKTINNLKEVNSKQPINTESKLSNNKGDNNPTLSNVRNNNNPKNALHLNVLLENQMDIFKPGGINFNEKKNTTPATVESKDKSKNVNKDKAELVYELDLENTEQFESDSKNDSVTESDDYDTSDKDVNRRHTVNIQEDDERNNAVDALTEEVDWTNKERSHKNLKYTKTLSMDAYSAEAERHKKVKGFTSGNIQRLGNNRKYEEMPDFLQYSEVLTKPKKKKYNMNHKTTSDSKSRIYTIWEETYSTKKQQNNRDKDEAITSSDSNSDDVEKATKASADFKSRIRHNKKKYRDLKLRKIKSKYIPKVKRVVSSVLNDNNKENLMQDFSFNAQLENMYPKGGEGLKLKIAALKKNDFGKKSLRTKIKTDEKAEESDDHATSSKLEMEEALNTTDHRSKSSDASTEEENSKALTKRHKTSKKSKNKQHKTIQASTEEEIYIMSREEVITTKLPKKVKKSSKIQSSSKSEKFFSDKSTENQNVFSKEDEIQATTKITRKPTKTKISLMKQKSVERSIEGETHESSEEDLQTTIKITKKDEKPHKKTKSTPKHTKTVEKSIEKINESTEKLFKKEKHKNREKSSKRHTYKKRDNSTEKPLDEEHLKSIENEEETQSKKLINKENFSEKRKSFPKNVKRRTYVKPKADIFISIENKKHPSKSSTKTVKAFKNEETTKRFPTSPPASKKAKFKGRNSSNAERYKTLSEFDDDSHKKLEKVVNTKVSISRTPTPQMVEKSTDATSTVETSSSTPELYETPVTASKTGSISTDLNMRASQENKSSNVSNEKSSLKLEDKTTQQQTTTKRISRSYLQLIDFIENGTTVKLNLDAIKTTINEELKPKHFKYTLSDFWKRHSNKVEMKTKDLTDTTTKLTMTTENNIAMVTTPTTPGYDEEKNPLRKKKRKKRKRTTTIAPIAPIPTAVYRRSNAIEHLNNSKPDKETTTNRKPLDNKLIADKENATNPTTLDNKIDFYNDNNTDYDKATGVGEELKDFLDLHDIKLDNKNYTEINLDTVNALIGPEVNFPENVKRKIEAGLKDGTARRNLDRDIMKLYGTPISDIALSTPINSLYTDPLDNLN